MCCTTVRCIYINDIYIFNCPSFQEQFKLYYIFANHMFGRLVNLDQSRKLAVTASINGIVGVSHDDCAAQRRLLSLGMHDMRAGPLGPDVFSPVIWVTNAPCQCPV